MNQDAPGAGLLAESPDDARLLALLRPAGYVNPEPHAKYDLVVVGGGTAGLVSAIGGAVLGARVALIEARLLGGDCLNFGCVPSKALLRAARAMHDASQASGLGIRARELEVDFPRVMERMRAARAAVAPHDALSQVASFGVHVFLGRARFTGEDSVDVHGTKLRFRRAIIATGSQPAALDIPGLTGAGYLTNESVFSLTELPRRLVVIGGGPVGCELSQAFGRLGAQVTLLQRSERLLPRDDADAARTLEAALASEGVRVMCSATVNAVDASGSAKVVVVQQNQHVHRIVADAILVAVGRSANVSELGLATARVDWDEEGVWVDDRLCTTNRRIYAAGDVCSTLKFTHAADAQARVALQNALFFGQKRVSRLVIPWCTYTDPEVAQVGVSGLAAASQSGCTSHTLQLAELDRAIVDHETIGFARVHVDRKGRLVGATLVGQNAGEMIGAAVLAVRSRITLAGLGNAAVPYPTRSELWKRLADEHARRKLTPRASRWLRLLFRALR